MGGDKNNTSLVLALRRELRGRLTEAEVSDFTMLLMGDAEGESEAEMLKRGDLSGCHILKAGHHGSAGASTEAFLEAVCPEWALISCGEKEPLRPSGRGNAETSGRGRLSVADDGPLQGADR